MSDESCTCGCATKPAEKTSDDCTCGCNRSEKESKDGAIAQ